MKKLFLFIIAFLVGFGVVVAQDEVSFSFPIKLTKESKKVKRLDKGFAFALEIGANFSNLSHNIEAKNLSYSGLLTGWKVNLGLEYHLNEVHYFSTGLGYHLSGASDIPQDALAYFYKKDLPSKDLKDINGIELSSHILSLPLNYGVNLPFEFDDFILSLEGGLYFAYTLSSELEFAKVREEVRFDEELKPEFTFNDSNKIGSFNLYESKGSEALRRWEMGLGLSLLLKFKEHFRLRLGTNYGLTNMYQESVNKWKNRDYYISVGVSF